MVLYALHVRFTFWYISLPSSRKWWREMTKFMVLWRSLAHEDEFLVLSLRFQPTHISLIPRQLLHIFKAKRYEIVCSDMNNANSYF